MQTKHEGNRDVKDRREADILKGGGVLSGENEASLSIQFSYICTDHNLPNPNPTTAQCGVSDTLWLLPEEHSASKNFEP